MKVRKQMMLTQKNVEYLEVESERSGLSQSDILRRLIDRAIEESKSKTYNLKPKN